MQQPSPQLAQDVQWVIEQFGIAVAAIVGLVVLAALGGTWLAKVYLGPWVKAKAVEQVDKEVRAQKAAIDRELEAYKSELAVTADAVRVTYQRQLQEFSLYVAKRHQVYAELFRAVLEAEGALGQLFQPRRGPLLWEEADDADLRQALVERQVPAARRAAVSEALDAGDRQRAIELLRAALRNADERDALFKERDARNYYLVNELYLSDDVRNAAGDAFAALRRVAWCVEMPYLSGTALDADVTALPTAVNALRAVMRREISRSDYQLPMQVTLAGGGAQTGPPPGGSDS